MRSNGIHLLPISEMESRPPRPFRSIAIVLVASSIAAFFFAEFGLRAYFHFVQDYDMEMWRYATELKTSVSDARSHVHSPSSSARIMGADVTINSK